MSKLELGELQITALTDIERFDVPLTTIFPEAKSDAIKNITWIGPEILSSGLLHLKIRSWLLRLNGQVILIDTCVGAHKDRPNWQDWHQRDGVNWLSALAAEGLKPDDVDVVMCTHLHADHVGWNTKLLNGRWVPTFQNARYICSKDEYGYWSEAAALGDDKHGSFSDSVLPIMEANKMELVDSDWDLG
ncbi:MAG: MBL fold metallo-hydrolase, partial [Rhodobacterales bacterium]|nr:MBL fold metallo-hydrolase [Rhodobacterales bacterium]